MSRGRPALKPHNANALPVRLYRYVRTCVHVSAGVATVTLSGVER